MSDFLSKLFIKNYKETNNTDVRESYGKLSSIIGIILNIFLCTSKIFIGTLFHNISITADGINNLSDASTSIITLICFKLSNKPADEKHPFGHARIEYIAGLAVSFAILMIGVEIIQSSVNKILHPTENYYDIIMIIILVASIIVKLILAKVNYSFSKKIKSTTLKATAKDSLNDVIATTAILISIFIGKLTNLKVDGYMGIVVSIIIIYSGIDILKDILNPLIGEPPTKEFINIVAKKILSYDGVINIHDLVVHTYGISKIYATVHVEVSANENILISHELIDKIERDFSNDLNINLVIHLDPIIINDKETNILKEKIKSIIYNINPNFSIHDFRLKKSKTHKNVLFDIVITNDCKLSSQTLLQIVNEEIKKIDQNLYPIIVIDKHYNNYPFTK